MGNLIEINTYEIRDSENLEYKIPIINGVPLHSSRDAKGEAVFFIKRHVDELITNKNILVMGLGMGFHVQEIVNILRDVNKTDYQIVVIEPNLKTIEDCHTYNKISDNRVLIFYDQNIDNLFANAALADFILKSPKLIIHPASYSVYRKYFRRFLTYGAVNSINAVASQIVNDKLKRHLNNLPADMSIKEYCEKIIHRKDHRYLEDNDFLLLAYEKIK